MIFVGDEILATAFKLIGVESKVAFDIIDAEKIINKILDEAMADLLIIPEDLYEKLVERHFKFRREGKEKPILAVVPGLRGATGRRLKDIYNLISQAVGVRLKLGGE